MSSRSPPAPTSSCAPSVYRSSAARWTGCVGREDAFVDRTIEAEERAEEAVIGKEARITEEIGLRRDAEERTETVSDTVRHTEVEVEDERDDLSRVTEKKDPSV